MEQIYNDPDYTRHILIRGELTLNVCKDYPYTYFIKKELETFVKEENIFVFFLELGTQFSVFCADALYLLKELYPEIMLGYIAVSYPDERNLLSNIVINQACGVASIMEDFNLVTGTDFIHNKERTAYSVFTPSCLDAPAEWFDSEEPIKSLDA